MKENPLVSIIVPVYNVEKYISRCITSLTSQTYQNLEIILVNDGSTDRSSEICDYMKQCDCRINVYHRQNEGAGFARNFGMDIATGKYAMFVDSDDYIVCNCIERMVGVAEKNRADFVRCKYIRGNSSTFSIIPKQKKEKKLSHKDAFNIKGSISVCGVLYATELFDGIRYPRVTLHDDEFFTYKLIYKAKKIIYLDEIYYYYYMSPNSIMRSDKRNIPLEYIRAYNERINYFIQERQPQYEAISHKEFAIRLMLSYLNRIKYNDGEKHAKQLLELFKKHYELGKKTATGMKEKSSLFVFNLWVKLCK